MSHRRDFFSDGGQVAQTQRVSASILAGVISGKQIQAELRKLAGRATPDDFADEVGVDRSTMYRLFGKKPYVPKLETIGAIVEARGLTLSAFFAQIEALPAGAQPASITDTPKPIEAAGAPIPADDSAFAARMVSLCLTAAELSDRDATRAGLEELAVAFAMAAPAGLAQETKNKVKSRRPPRRQAS